MRCGHLDLINNAAPDHPPRLPPGGLRNSRRTNVSQAVVSGCADSGTACSSGKSGGRSRHRDRSPVRATQDRAGDQSRAIPRSPWPRRRYRGGSPCRFTRCDRATDSRTSGARRSGTREAWLPGDWAAHANERYAATKILRGAARLTVWIDARGRAPSRESRKCLRTATTTRPAAVRLPAIRPPRLQHLRALRVASRDLQRSSSALR